MKKSRKMLLFFVTVMITVAFFSFMANAEGKEKSSELKILNISSGVYIDWDGVKGAVRYKVYRKGAKDKKRTVIATVESSDYIDKNVKNGKRYSYSVKPVFDGLKDGKLSEEKSLTRLGRPMITKSYNSVKGVTLIWTASEGATSYRIYRKTGDNSWKRIGKTNAATLTFTDEKAKDKYNYTYMVKGCNKDCSSTRSNYEKTDFLSSPEIIKMSSNKSSITVKWEKVKKAETYRIYRIKPGETKAVYYKTVDSSKQSFTDKDVKTGKKYAYTVRAVDENGKLSGKRTAEECVLMKAPEITKAVNTTNGVKLSWTKVASAESYNVYKRENNNSAWVKILTCKGLTATDKDVKNGDKISYTVRAVYNGVQSSYDKVGFVVRYLSAPAGVKVKFAEGKGNVVSWQKNKVATAYNIYRKNNSGGEWKRIGRTEGTSFTDKSAAENTLYLYYVRAYINKNYKSAASVSVLSSIVDPDGKMVALTYDDGPSNIITTRVVDTLEKYNARATFFVLGSRINEHYKPMQKAVKIGCEIGNHTYGHINLPSFDEDEIKKEISSTNNLVKKYTGKIPVLARAPGGSTDSYSRSAVNMPFIYWSIDTRDWETMHAPSIIAHVKNETYDGSIILMHDVYEATADATEVIVPWLISEGYQLVTVSELMYYRGIELQKGVTYYNGYR